MPTYQLGWYIELWLLTIRLHALRRHIYNLLSAFHISTKICQYPESIEILESSTCSAFPQ